MTFRDNLIIFGPLLGLWFILFVGASVDAMHKARTEEVK